MSGNAIVPIDLAGIHALRDANDDAYWSPAVQSAELALVAAENAPPVKALATIERMKRDIGDWSTMAAVFDELPESVHQAVADELLAEAPIWLDDATWEVQQNFRSLPEGRELMRAWGDNAAPKLAIVRERMIRIHMRLSDEDSDALSEWFNSLESDEARSVLALLAGTA
jgi:hypothetical protein